MVGKENFVHTLFAAALLAAVAVSGGLSGLTGEDTIPSPVSREESREIAREYDISQPEYRDYQGRNLTLAGTTPYDCPSCYEFAYTFEMQSTEDPWSWIGGRSGYRSGKAWVPVWLPRTG